MALVPAQDFEILRLETFSAYTEHSAPNAMPQIRYRLATATRAVHAENGAKGFVLVPEGAEVRLDAGEAAGNLVRIHWQGETLIMFRQDLLERGERVEAEAT